MKNKDFSGVQVFRSFTSHTPLLWESQCQEDVLHLKDEQTEKGEGRNQEKGDGTGQGGRPQAEGKGRC